VIRETAASAPGKVILSGEHFVVHGSYSVAAAINRRVHVRVREFQGPKPRIVLGDQVSTISSDDGSFPVVKTVARDILSMVTKTNQDSFEISITSDIPPGSGLGSSAAVSLACAGALADFMGLTLNKNELSDMAFRGESKVHGNPSGVDVQSCLNGGLILFKKNSQTEKISLRNSFCLLVVFSGKKRSTSKLVAKVAKRREEYPNQFKRMTESVSDISLEVVEAAKGRDMRRMGSLFTLIQSQLSWIGVSTLEIDMLIEDILGANGVLGAKITGAGGGGSIIAAIDQDSGDSTLKSVSQKYPYSFISDIPQEGLRWEKPAS
jgi:mevalonate kinase